MNLVYKILERVDPSPYLGPFHIAMPIHRVPVETLYAIFEEVLYSPVFDIYRLHNYTLDHDNMLLEEFYEGFLQQHDVLRSTCKRWKEALWSNEKELVIYCRDYTSENPVRLDPAAIFLAYRLTMTSPLDSHGVDDLAPATKLHILDIYLAKETFAHLLPILSQLPALRALFLRCEQERTMCLGSLSKAAPNLRNLSLAIEEIPNPNIVSPLSLKHLTTLFLYADGTVGWELKAWDLPNLLHLSVMFSEDIMYEDYKEYGPKLLSLCVYSGQFPFGGTGFEKAFPQLKEISTSSPLHLIPSKHHRHHPLSTVFYYYTQWWRVSVTREILNATRRGLTVHLANEEFNYFTRYLQKVDKENFDDMEEWCALYSELADDAQVYDRCGARFQDVMRRYPCIQEMDKQRLLGTVDSLQASLARLFNLDEDDS